MEISLNEKVMDDLNANNKSAITWILKLFNVKISPPITIKTIGHCNLTVVLRDQLKKAYVFKRIDGNIEKFHQTIRL